ncbi:MAG: preprotein translocase subunit SecG [Ruminococcaceae bacterium]|nr:preprotein translocase subunit SecG [Oscillospiraceae bacterium]
MISVDMEVFFVGVFEIIGSILLILSCIVLVVVISMQSSKSSGLNALGAMQEDNTVAGRNKAKTMDAMMLKITKIVAIAMFVLTFVVYAIGAFVK